MNCGGEGVLLVVGPILKLQDSTQIKTDKHANLAPSSTTSFYVGPIGESLDSSLNKRVSKLSFTGNNL